MVGDEKFLGEELPVDRPDEEELAPEVERPSQVRPRVLQEERRGEQQLDRGTHEQRPDGGEGAEGLDEEQEEPGGEEEDVHLDGDCQRVEDAAEVPAVADEEEDGEVAEEHGPAVVEEPQHEDGVDALGAGEGGEHQRGELPGLPEDEHQHGD